MTAAKRVGARLRELRRASGESLSTLADRAGVYRQNLRRLERGDHDPLLSSIARYARALDVPVATIVEVLDEPEAK